MIFFIIYGVGVGACWSIAISQILYRDRSIKSSLKPFFKRIFHAFLWPFAVLNPRGREAFKKLYGG